MRRLVSLSILLLATLPALAAEKPLMRDFIGLNVHTVNFKPDLYAPVTKVLRDYHPIGWDLGKDTSVMPEFPFAKNRVDWARCTRRGRRPATTRTPAS